MNTEKEVLKERTESCDDLVTLIKRDWNKLPMIPYETLEMIQEADGQRMPLLRLFNCLDELPSIRDLSEELDFRLIIIFEGISYVKEAFGKNLFLVNIVYDNQLKRNAHYIVLLKSRYIEQTDFFAKVASVLDEERIEYEKEIIKTPLFNVPPPWKVENIIKTNLIVKEKI